MTATADHVALPDAPEGTCVPVKRDPKRWWVKGETGWYLVHPDTGHCNCPDAQWHPNKMCKHARYLTVVVQAQVALAEVSPTVVMREAA